MARNREEETAGKKFSFDPNFRGPLQNRSCTDVICLLMFLVFLVAWIIVGGLAFKNGNPEKLLVPHDTDGRFCGIDESVIDRPFLFYFDITKCLNPALNILKSGCPTTQLCVKECPNALFSAIKDGATAGRNFSDFKRKLICRDGIKDTINGVEDINADLFQENKCAAWYLPSVNVAGRCLPGTDISFNLDPTYNVTEDKIKQATEIIQALAAAKEIAEMIIQDLKVSWPWIVAGLGIAVLVCLLYIFLLRYIARILIWLSLLASIAILGYCCYATFTKYQQLKDAVPSPDADQSKISTLLANRDTWLALLITSAVVLVIVLLIVIFLRKRLNIAAALIGESSKAVSSTTSTLLFPFVPWILECIVLAWTVGVAMCLIGWSDPKFEVTNISSGCSAYKIGDKCNPSEFKKICSNANDICNAVEFIPRSHIVYLHIFNIFGLFWGLCFVSAFGEMVLAATFATWYWTFDKRDVPFFTLMHGFGRTVRYHLGTLAFGSLILAICKAIRATLEYIDHKLNKYNNAFVKGILCCLRCFFWCLEKFIKFINRNAYIMCAIHGKNFCRSARSAFNLLLRNIVRVVVLDKVTDFLLFLGKLAITAGMMALSFYVFSEKVSSIKTDVPLLKDVPKLNYSMVPMFIVGIGTYFIATFFFGVYNMAVDTLFLCFLEDIERNDGSPEKPYFMSNNLMKIIGKKNKYD